MTIIIRKFEQFIKMENYISEMHFKNDYIQSSVFWKNVCNLQIILKIDVLFTIIINVSSEIYILYGDYWRVNVHFLLRNNVSVKIIDKEIWFMYTHKGKTDVSKKIFMTGNYIIKRLYNHFMSLIWFLWPQESGKWCWLLTIFLKK